MSTTALLIGWATGGIIFGILGDRIGRAKTLTIMIVCYSVSTGLCGLSTGPWDYVIYCFITGVGAGGIFPIACTLVAESLPDRTRPQALGMVQTFSALGNIGAGVISLGFVALLAAGVISTHWRWMFSVGIVPSLLAIIVARRLREPEAWKRAAAEGKARKAGLGELFSDRRWRRNAIVGLLLAASGVVGLWGIGVFSNDLTQFIIGDRYDKQQCQAGEGREGPAIRRHGNSLARWSCRGKTEAISRRGSCWAATRRTRPKMRSGSTRRHSISMRRARRLPPKASLPACEMPTANRCLRRKRRRLAATLAAQPSRASIEDHVNRIVARQKARNIEVLQWAAWTLICFNIGAFFGMYAFARVTQSIGRRPTFAIFFTIAMVATALAFGCMEKMPRDLWMVALMGGAQLSVFGGYAIYFPELFPTRLRSTGTSFCYNVGRYVAAIGPLSLAVLKPALVKQFGDPVLAFRYAGMAMCSCFLVGLVALLFARRRRGSRCRNKTLTNLEFQMPKCERMRVIPVISSHS